MTEVQIIQELLYCFQGIEGNILRSDGDNGFKLDPLVTWKMLTLHDVEQCFPTFFTMHDKVVIDLKQKLQCNYCFHYTVKLKTFLDMTYL